MSLKSDLLKVGFSNFIVLISSLFNSFVLPSLLSIKGYADYKTYVLYASFIGFLHFGFVDGINIKYGGINRANINYNEFNQYHEFFILFQFLITLFFSMIGLVLQYEILFFICLAIIPINLQSFFLFFYQAIGEFNLYSRSTIIVPFCNITFTIFLLLFNVINYKAFVIAHILSYYISVIFLETRYYQAKKKFLYNTSDKLDQNNENIFEVFIKILKYHKYIFVSGFFITVGSVLFNLFFSTGRWIAKIFTNDEMFAIYSLSLSLIGIIVIFVSAVNQTFYPYLHRNQNLETIKRLRKILFIIGTISMSSFFLLKIIIINFLPKYLEALPITAIVIASIPGIFIVKSIYANLYKVNKIESKFLRDTIIYLIIGLIFNILFYLYFQSLVSIAVASVLTIYLWTIFPLSFQICPAKNKFSELIYLLLITTSFYYLYYLDLNNLLSFVVSFIILVSFNMLFFKETFISLIKTKI